MKKEKPARAVERAAVEMQKKNQSYKLLSDSEEEESIPAPSAVRFKVSICSQT